MPYFIYKVSETPIRRLEKLEQHEAFRAASSSAKKMRAEQAEGNGYRIKVIFGETELHAEDALNQLREPVPGDD